MHNKNINFNQDVIKELINSTIECTPGVEEWKIKLINYVDEVITIEMSIKVKDEIKNKCNVIEEFKNFLKNKLKSVLDNSQIELKIN